MELDFDKYCILDSSPTTVLPPPKRRSKVSNRKSNHTKFGNDVNLNEEFIEIGFNRYRSASCRDATSKRSNAELLKRGSVYQSSKEVSFLKKSDVEVGRTKIEFSRESDSTFSFGINVIDSLCSLDENESLVDEQSRSSEMSLSEQSTSSICKQPLDLRSKRHSSHPITRRTESVISPMNDGNFLQERGPSLNLHKSLSAKLALPHSPAQSESDGSKASSPKSRFSPVRKIFDPLVKSKSQRSPLSCGKENGRETIIENKEMICKSLLNDLVEYDSLFEKEENRNLLPEYSPVHLHAILKLENKNGVPFFEFSVQSPEDFYIAKKWKVDKALNWVYTFHLPHHKRKSNADGWGFKEIHKESSILGQMRVSCYLCTELQGNGVFEDSMVTEFVSYDISHSRKSVSSQDNSTSSPVVKGRDDILSWGNCEQNVNSVKTKIKGQFRHSRESVHFDSSTFQPLPVADLHPEIETAAVVMKIPFQKRESLKFKSGEKKIKNLIPNLLDLCQLEQAKEVIFENSSVGKMNVVVPLGNHSLPSDESRGPSPLLDRWRLGGGCDCGGWDMACPINVFGNSNIRIAEGSPLMDNQHPAELFLQGRKDNLPAFSMRAIENGKYAVDFHAKLSSLQAFSICVAILHAAEASTAVGQEGTKQIFQSDSMRVFPEKEIKNLIDAIAGEEELKLHKKTEEALPSFVINPPFSPIARV